MTAVVLDACLIVCAVREASAGDDGECRSAVLEAITGVTRPGHGPKLRHEYSQQLKQFNGHDLAEAFVQVIGAPDRADRFERDNLSSPHHARARECVWPSHDDHLLGVGLQRSPSRILTTELALGRASAKVSRHFSIRVEQLTSSHVGK